MKIIELIEQLQNLDEDMDVLIYTEIGEEHAVAKKVEIANELDGRTWRYDKANHPFEDCDKFTKNVAVIVGWR